MKKILTIALDGFGMREDIYGNAVKNAGMHNFIKIWNEYPHCLVNASSSFVGLPEGQCSDSNIGYKIINAGRIIEHRLVISNEFFYKKKVTSNPKASELIQNLKRTGKSLHIVILLSDGGISSHIEHLKLFLKEIEDLENKIYIHAIADGKDAPQQSILKYVQELIPFLNSHVHLATICGRNYALDYTKNYKRTELYYNLLMEGAGIDCEDLNKMITLCYQKKMNDEYLPPLKMTGFNKMEEDEYILFLNFSKQNQNQLLEALTVPSFSAFKRTMKKINIYSLFDIEKKWNKNYFFTETPIQHTLCEYIAELGFQQARIIESCCAQDISYYLDGMNEHGLVNCDTFIVESPKVASFIQKPEMNALSISKTIIRCMEKDYDFIFASFVNPNELGHTGNFHATVNCLQAIDVCLGKIIEHANDNFYKVIIVGTHGNVDTIVDRNNQIITKNTLSPVPFIIVDKKIKLRKGNLSAVAPTILKYMDIALPKEMKKTEDLFDTE